ncbi:substrate-binding domain-containing protein [Tianweitania sp. BSSL-BM11]|uniref:Substrate-binding domain-containing protein n=1 Tax=Tianweitania aestuarii TaxID=2814886 RepID=A0ABS5RYG3_9HYPH|nr:substrate-binding domain-containing protein [Tianweitania aestuarii]MBS9722088.1 substrate-binding domain-containing protein [Tianweitania aestuarii]
MATLADVAAQAGCSQATASRALTKSGKVSEKMVRRVVKAAVELGYRAPFGASGTSSRRRAVVGVLIPSITNPVFATSVSVIQNRMLMAGHRVLIALSNYDPAQEADAIATLLVERPAGLILTLCNPGLDLAVSGEMPHVVLMNNRPSERFPAAVAADNHAAGFVMTRHLIEHHHRSILFVSGSFASSDRALQRYAGYRAMMEKAGLQPLEALEVGFGDYDGLDLGEALRIARPTAIIASNDLLALGVIGALRRDGLSVPDDISVAGFDGIAIGRMINPVLTTIEMPDVSIGAAAASLLLDMADNGAAPRHLEIPFSLRAGGTVRRL